MQIDYPGEQQKAKPIALYVLSGFLLSSPNESNSLMEWKRPAGPMPIDLDGLLYHLLFQNHMTSRPLALDVAAKLLL
jgi:hypothetical protein